MLVAEGVTNLDAKGDGVHFISNGKDQCVKLWDMRRSYSNAEGHEKASRRDVPRYHWCARPPCRELNGSSESLVIMLFYLPRLPGCVALPPSST